MYLYFLVLFIDIIRRFYYYISINLFTMLSKKIQF